MFRFKKAGSFLSILMVFAVVAGTFPIQAWAEVYTGELQLPNTQVVNDYRQSGGGQATLNKFNNSYFASEPSFTLRDSNNFITSLPQKIFSASIRDGVLNCTGDDINLNAANSNIVLTGIGYNNDENSSTYSFLCQPIAAYPTTQNTILNREGSGNSHGGLGVVQTYDALPVLTLGESAQTTTVESIPNDPNNVRVTVSENVTQEVYGMHFERRGDVWYVIGGRDLSLWYEDYNLYKDGTNYIINWLSNWVGQMSIPLNDDYGSVIWGDPSTYGCDYETGTGSGRCTMDPLYVNTGYPTPQIVQLASIAPALVSNSIVRPRNGDILSITQPQYTRWSTCSWFRGCTQHMYAIVHEISADGRTGRGIIYQSWDTGGGFRDFLGVAILVAGAVIGAELGINFTDLFSQIQGLLSPNLPFQAISDAVVASSNPLQTLFPALTTEAIQGSIAGFLTSSIGAEILSFTAGAVAAIAGPTALGTVEQSIASSGVEGQEGVWIWTWSQAPGFQATTGGGSCPNGSLDYPACPPIVEPRCPNGATNYPICTVVNTCVDPAANNFGRALPCTYDPGRKCEDPAAINFNGALPCRYRPITCSANFSYCGTGANADKLCQRTYGSAPQCTLTESCAACSYGCADSACVPTPPSPNITGWQVAPTLLRSGESTFVSWNTTDVSDCAVSGTNGDSWSGTTGDRKQSSAILGQTTFSISCTALSGASPSTVSMSPKTVNIIPTFQER